MTDLRYRPVLADAAETIRALRPSRLLIVGDIVPDTVEYATHARLHHPGEVKLPTGLYDFSVDAGTDALLVTTGASPAPPSGTAWDAEDDHPLLNALAWLDEWWGGAAAIPRPSFSNGEQVMTVPAGQEGTVRRREFDAGAPVLGGTKSGSRGALHLWRSRRSLRP